MEETSFSGVELAGRARVAPEVVGRLVELGILGAGLSLEGIGAAMAQGPLSLVFLDLLSVAGRPLTGTTYAELCEQEGLPMELVQRVHEASGLGRPLTGTTRSIRWTGTCWGPPGWGGRWGWTTGC
jgi:hypothetical protein